MFLDVKDVYLLLGSNLGDRLKYLNDAIDKIQAEVGEVFVRSSVYETAAWGKTDQPGFLNLAIGIKTNFPPLEVLEKILKIETDLGRVRLVKWGERVVDIDLILYGDDVIEIENKLSVPHIEMQNRKFVLMPLAEIAPKVMHPVLHKTISYLLKNVKDTLRVTKINL